MKRKENKHTSKSPSQRRNYSKAIRELSYDPTVDDSINFSSSDEVSERYKVEDVPPKRPVTINDRLAEIRDKHGLTIIGSIIFLVATYFVFDFNRDLTEVKAKQENLKENIQEIKSDIKDLRNKDQEHELKLKEQEIRNELTDKSKKK